MFYGTYFFHKLCICEFQELIHIKSHVLHAGLVQQKLQRLSTYIEDALEKCLLTYPAISHALINHLHCDNRFFENTNCQLKEIYVSAVKRCIESIKGDTSVQGTIIVLIYMHLLITYPIVSSACKCIG